MGVDHSRRDSRRLGWLLWLAGMAGVVVLCLTVLPQLLARLPTRVPLEVALLAGVVQSGLILALAVWAGLRLSVRVGLDAPLLRALVGGTGTWPTLRRQLPAAVLAGVLLAALLVLTLRQAPAALASSALTLDIPLAAKLLYGGVTEEILMRWGLMTTLLWLLDRAGPSRGQRPGVVPALTAIALAALLFGAGHLPAVAALGVPLDGPVVAFILVGNTLPGLAFGLLYWRYGLEAAMFAHALAHLGATLVQG